MKSDDRIVVAVVLGAHGTKGELRIGPLTDFPERFRSMKEISLFHKNQGPVTFPLLEVRELRSRGQLILRLEGLKNRDEALVYRGWSVFITPDELMPLEPGQYWIRDLVGLRVKDTAGQSLGVVQDVMTTGASDIFEILGDDSKVHLVPFVEEFVKEVDLDRRELVIAMMEGLWD